MNSDIEIRLHLNESSSWDPARDRFLESLGFGDALLAAETAPWPGGVPDEVEDEDGVVLSSQPDDFSLPAPLTEVSPHRATSLTPDSTLGGSRHEWFSIPAEEDRVASEEVSVAIVPMKAMITPHADERLHHKCPECDGELVLQRRHLGVEGLCVWCLCPIVAAESAGDSRVRIFPILRRSSKRPFPPAVSAAVPLAAEPAGAGQPDFSPLGFKPREEVSAFAFDALDDSEGDLFTPPTHDFARAFQMTGFDRPAGQADLGFFSGPEQTNPTLPDPAKPIKNDFASAFTSPGAGFCPPLGPGEATVEVSAGVDLSPAPEHEPAETRDDSFREVPDRRKNEAGIRRGVFVLIFVIVGLTIGTALASLVLPVDDYVHAARAFMERQLTPSAAERSR